MSKSSDAVQRFRERRRTEARVLLGNKCARCGAPDNLEFDHIDPTTKKFQISNGLQKDRATFFAEVAKCQLLCGPCHRIKSGREQTGRTPWNKGKWQHGTLTGYQKCRCDECRAYYSQWKRSRRGG